MGFMKPMKSDVAQAPQSWDIENWPANVWPHTTSRARYTLRIFRAELVAAGALARVGREIIILGSRYVAWLASKAGAVTDFDNGCARTKEPPAAPPPSRRRVVRSVVTCDSAQPGVPVIDPKPRS